MTRSSNAQRRRVLIFISDTGRGHRSVAEALSEQLRLLSDDIDCSIVDFFSIFRVPLLRWSPRIHKLLATRCVFIYNLLFRLSNTRAASAVLADVTYRLSRKRLREYLMWHRPEVVISAHPLYVSDALVKARNEFRFTYKIVTMVSDPVSPHASWACRQVDRCLVPTPEAQRILRRLGVSADILRITGFPIRQAFLEPVTEDVTQLRRALGLNEQRLTVVLTGGGNGSGPLESVATKVNEEIPNAQVIILTGHNAALLSRITRRPGTTIRALPFTTMVPSWFAASDVVVTKAGPSTIFEAAAVNRPVVIVGEVGLQERGNGRLAERLGLGYECAIVKHAPEYIRRATAILSRENSRCQELFGARRAVEEVLTLVAGSPSRTTS